MHLRHSTHSPTPQSYILIAVSPAVDSALDETTLLSKRRIQLRKSPTNRIALTLIVQAISLILVLSATCSRVHTICRLEFWAQFIDIHGFDVTPNRVLHLHPVSRVLKSDPLDSIAVLPHYKRSSCRDWTGSSTWIRASRGGW